MHSCPLADPNPADTWKQVGFSLDLAMYVSSSLGRTEKLHVTSVLISVCLRGT